MGNLDWGLERISRECRRPTRQQNVEFGVTLETYFRHRSFKSTKSAQPTQQKVTHRPVMSGNKSRTDKRRVVNYINVHHTILCHANRTRLSMGDLR